MNVLRDPVRLKKTKIQAETQAFTSQLFYYTVKILVCFIFYKYKNILWGDYPLICIFVSLLAINTYFMQTTGRDPGYLPLGTETVQEQEKGELISNNEATFCDICFCERKIRSKHCFRCGRCIRKFDHHCPWIGACVGQANHFRFWILTVSHLLQSCLAFWINFRSMSFYEYKSEEDTFGSEFGIFAIFSFFMFLYIVFAGVLVIFHGYLLIANTTTYELTRRHKATYLRGIKGNPFSKGPLQNIKLAIFVPPQGHQWQVPQPGEETSREKTWLQIIWSNKYYDCC